MAPKEVKPVAVPPKPKKIADPPAVKKAPPVTVSVNMTKPELAKYTKYLEDKDAAAAEARKAAAEKRAAEKKASA